MEFKNNQCQERGTFVHNLKPYMNSIAPGTQLHRQDKTGSFFMPPHKNSVLPIYNKLQGGQTQ